MGAFEKIIGYDAIKEKLNMALDAMHDSGKYKKIGVTIPKGILLDGKPGIGKTMLASEFVSLSGRNAYVIRKNKPDGEFVDYIRDTFAEAAKNVPAIILLDDMDKFANEDYFHRDAEEYVTIQACIDEVKEKDVFVIATTNDKSSLPDSLVRSGRFDWVFKMEMPKDEDAEQIMAFYLKDKSVEDHIDVKELSRFARGYSCASLAKVVNDAGLYAAYEGREKICQSDLINSCLRTFYGVKSNEALVPEEVQKRVAIHEAGHAVISEILEPGSVDFVSVRPHKSAEAGGLISRRNYELKELQYKSIEDNILISLAGKAATEVVLGETDIGANFDLHRAFDFVRELLDDYSVYGFDSWCHGNETAQSVYENLDRATSVEMSRYYKKVKQMLIQNRAFLDAVIEEVFERKTLSYKDLEVIRKGVSNQKSALL